MSEEHITIPRRYFAELEALRTRVAELEEECLQLSALQAAADKAAAEYERDAMRYCFLRKHLRFESEFVTWDAETEDDADAAIDEAMRS